MLISVGASNNEGDEIANLRFSISQTQQHYTSNRIQIGYLLSNSVFTNSNVWRTDAINLWYSFTVAYSTLFSSKDDKNSKFGRCCRKT